MGNELTKVNTEITSETIDKFLFSESINLTDQEKMLFLEIAKQSNLNPFKREIFVIKYKGKSEDHFSIITAYNVYIKRAELTGLLDGWNVNEIYDNKGKLTGAKIIIYRKDFTHPFEWHVSFDEFCGYNGYGTITKIWNKQGGFMIKKVCIGQGFRLAFPSAMGSLPYLQEELNEEFDKKDIPQTNNTPGIIPSPEPVKQLEEKKELTPEERYTTMCVYLNKLIKAVTDPDKGSMGSDEVLEFLIESNYTTPEDSEHPITAMSNLSTAQGSDFYKKLKLYATEMSTKTTEKKTEKKPITNPDIELNERRLDELLFVIDMVDEIHDALKESARVKKSLDYEVELVKDINDYIVQRCIAGWDDKIVDTIIDTHINEAGAKDINSLTFDQAMSMLAELMAKFNTPEAK